MRSHLMLTTCLTLISTPLWTSAVSAQDAELLKAIEAAGGQAMQIAQDDPHLTVSFHLSDKKITNKELAVLKGSEDIVELNLRGTAITDAGLKQIAKLKNLRKLHLEKTKVTDAGLKHLTGLNSLEYLNLYGTGITDAGLEHLKKIKSLKKVFLWQTKVTDAGQEALERALKETYVNRGVDKVDYPLIADKPLEAFVDLKKVEEKPEKKKEDKKKK